MEQCPQYYQETDEPIPLHHSEMADQDVLSTSSSCILATPTASSQARPEPPEWIQQVLQAQQAQLVQLTALLQVQMLNAVPPTPADTRPICAEDIYDFTHSDSADDYNYHIFTEHIYNIVAQYNEQCVLPSLISCLKNERTRT